MSVQHANRGVVKKDLQLYYNREFIKSFRGQATTNIAYATNNFLNSNSNWWVNSGNAVFNDNDTSIDKPIILNVDTSNLRIFSSTVTAVGNQQLGSSIIPISGSTQYSMSIYYWFSGGSMQAPPYVRANINNNELAYFGYNGDTNYLNWPRRTWIRLTATFTTQSNETGVYMSSYTGDTAGEKLAYFGYQIEQKAYVTPLVLGSRTANTVAGGGGLLDISGNNVNADLTNVSFNNTGYFFNGASSNRIIAKTYTATDPFWLNLGSISIWFKTSTNQNGVLVGWGDDGNTNFGSIEITADWTGGYADESLIAESYTASASQRAVIRKGSNYYANGVWTNITAVFDDNYLNLKIYINGVLETTSNNGSSSGAPFLNVSTSTSYFNIGRRTYGAGGEYFTGEIGQTMVYGRLLAAAEVLQNFNATRKTYGI
jgi:hypothetical protein